MFGCNLIESLLILVAGLLIGWAIGAARLHWPVIVYFRDYYRRQAEARMHQHTKYLLSLINLYGARTAALHQRAVPGAALGQAGSRLIPQRDETLGMLHQSTKGGQTTGNLTTTNSVCK